MCQVLYGGTRCNWIIRAKTNCCLAVTIVFIEVTDIMEFMVSLNLNDIHREWRTATKTVSNKEVRYVLFVVVTASSHRHEAFRWISPLLRLSSYDCLFDVSVRL